ncbi:hypothetical protein [Argonema galeatum]|uniref:hypothetical protein n=1 Tax=Argonema galeatum TaxID=2942762 RepID=UPI00201124EE|nr:hypothetical protein [Argonema galeatum]MCL1468412.1 hypothetical protein [Argonema galeatum A003/A1]
MLSSILISWYPVEGNNTIRPAPDVMVVFARPKGESPSKTLCDRGSYQQWRENNIPPQVVFIRSTTAISRTTSRTTSPKIAIDRHKSR